ncbi:MAG: hypothetical protein ABI867_13285 [Kofleriaceae bacterium]
MDPAELLDRLWAEGAGLDDRQDIAIARESATGRPADELAIWADWIATDEGRATGASVEMVERLVVDPVSALLVLAIELRAAVLRRDHGSIDEALAAIDRAIGFTPREDRGATAHAAADLALAETALYGRDLPAARRCLDGLAASGPTTLRITALMRMTTLALASTDVRTAQKRARQALTLARSTERRQQANQAQLLLGLVAYMNEDADTMRSTLEPLIAAEPDNSFTRFLLAGLEGPERATAILGEGLGLAAQRGDALGYALCALVGARRYVALGKRADALLVMSSVRVQLTPHSEQLLAVLDSELATWKTQWGDAAFAQAERDAIALLDS